MNPVTVMDKLPGDRREVRSRASAPRYQQVAEELRQKVSEGAYRAGHQLPTESELERIYSVSRMTVRRALAVLCEQGIVHTGRGKPAIVREGPVRRELQLPPGSRLVVRMPTTAERLRLGLHRGVPVLELRRPGRRVALIGAEAVEVVQPAPS